jgi:hypothetical protein
MLGGQVGFAISTHYCGGKVADRSISLLEKKMDCGMEFMQDSCPSMEDVVLERSCCENESNVYQLDEDFQKKQQSIDWKSHFFAVFVLNYSLLFEQEQSLEAYAMLPNPPLIQQNTQVLFQSFLL